MLVVGIAFGAALLGSLSGGSTSMITTPAWMALGTPFATAVAADKVAATLWTVVASRNYLSRDVVDGRLLLLMGSFGLVGAAGGAFLATAVDPHLLRRLAGAVILAALIWSARRRPARDSTSRPLSDGATAVLTLPLGIYEGLLGSGNAIFVTLLLQRARGWSLLRALGHYYALGAVWCGLAAGIYFARGAMDWSLALPVSVGALAGAAVGSRLGRAGGPTLVRPLFLVAGTLLSCLLLFGR